MIRELIGFMSGETAYLYYLHTTKDKETCLSDISRMLGVTKGRITAMTASLSRKEMVSPKTDPEDRRRLILTLTDKGRAFIVTKQQRIDRFLDKYIQTVGEEKTDRVIQTLKDAMDGMKEVAF
jgi:DNA-binding MarR family transcriptional regulator